MNKQFSANAIKSAKTMHSSCNLAYGRVVGCQIDTAAGSQTDIGDHTAAAGFASGKQDPQSIAALKNIYPFWLEGKS